MTTVLTFSLFDPGEIFKVAQSSESELERNTPFQKLEQSSDVKGIVTVVGLGLIGLELWWFKGSKSNSK